MSLRWRLALAFAVILVASAGIISFVVGELATERVAQQSQRQLANLAFQMRDKLDRGLFERVQDIELAATQNDLFDPLTSRDLQRARLQRLQQSFATFAWIGFADDRGQVLAATGGLLEGESVAQRPWFSGALAGTYVGDVQEAKLLQKFLAPDGAEPLRFVDIAVPVRDTEGRLLGVLGAHLSWEWADEIRSSVLTSLGDLEDVDVLVLSDSGQVLLGPSGLIGETLPLRPHDGQGMAVAAWPDGKRYLAAISHAEGYRSYAGLDWWVVVRQSETEALGAIAHLRLSILLLGAAVGAIFMGGGWAIARRIARPLEALTAAAESIGSGRGQAVPAVGGYREARQLSHSLALAVATMRRQRGELKQMNATLERRVEERTRELIESQAATETNRRQLAAIFDSVMDALLSIDNDGLIGNANRAAERLFGRSHAELLGRKAWDLFSDVKRLPGDEGAEGGVRTVEAVAKNAGGFNVPVEVTLSSELLGNQHLTTLSIRDISLWREIERLRTELLSTVGYELRTPLTSLAGAVDLADALGRDLPNEIRELLDIAQRNSRRLTQVVNDILDAERIQAGRLQLDLQRLDGHEAVKEAVAAFAGTAADKKLRLEMALPAQSLPLRADPHRLQQVLGNLIGNALKYAPEGSAVTVAAERKAREIRITVIDQGPGVPAEFRDRIFQRFARAEPAGETAGKPHGTGLGLAIAKAIVEQHGGAIGYDSKPGNTLFWFALPLRRD